MLYSVEQLTGFKIEGTDGEVGKVHEFYFDDHSWKIRYVIVDTGGWLPGRRVLLAPAALKQPDRKEKHLPVKLTTDQIKNSPEIRREEPVSRQKEIDMLEYYQWPIYWDIGAVHVPSTNYVLAREVAEKRAANKPEEIGDPHLRSTNEVNGYHIQAVDEEIGHVEDFIIDVNNWDVRFMVIDTRNWLPGKKVVIAPRWIKDVNWAESKVMVDLAKEQIKESPEYKSAKKLDEEYVSRVYSHYGKKPHWK
ncbi:MAG: PRC-barrel domain-containing protein [Calditrichia bacterium]